MKKLLIKRSQKSLLMRLLILFTEFKKIIETRSEPEYRKRYEEPCD